jgi:hypothetical protein
MQNITLREDSLSDVKKDKMEGYLGETIMDVSQTEFKDYTRSDWALLWIGKYGDIDGAHHKDWVLDHVSRILNGTRVIVKLARWDNGYSEHRFIRDEPSQEYHEWVREIMSGEEGPFTYGYDIGIAP